MPATAEQFRATVLILQALKETVEEAGEMGAPAGVMYAACMSHGITLSQFESLMAILERTGKVTKRGQLYFAT